MTELGLDDHSDTLGCWMAHYVAELLDEAKDLDGQAKSNKLAELQKAILALWDHRACLPNGKRPFENMEPILTALEGLDPASQAPRFSLIGRAPKPSTEEIGETARWIRQAEIIDSASKVLINHCLASAAAEAFDEAAQWAEITKQAELSDVTIELRVIDFLGSEKAIYENDEFADHQRRALTERRAKLQALVSAAKSLEREIDRRLEDLDKNTSLSGHSSDNGRHLSQRERSPDLDL